MKESSQVADHYNNIKSIGVKSRSSSEIIAIREVNNFLKLKLIQKFLKENAVVLDLGCGKGGDLSKLKHRSVKHYYGCDIAKGSLKEALSRSMTHSFKTDFLEVDFTKKKIIIEQKADLVMAQFSFHYCFASEICVRRAVMNVCNNLKPGGFFIMTVPCKSVITRRSKRNPETGSFGNTLYKIIPKEPFSINGLFGESYDFYLEEALTGCEEYLTDINYLTKLFAQNGLKKVFDIDFLSFLNKEMVSDNPTYLRMVKRMLCKEEIQIIELYRAVAYKKL
ncbi:mRNA (guanine-N7-)-methyltransferase [Nematocida major]|uniref:mRNA (guanine-N7-)-methyltransferase n=1 Tax=Nematocida major TaxID=1912982 RepID=UPI0020078398|nr:mRNA (guanine-N7-)-methyltransferase [Nematocida major]KAH9385144.1 mRNA (guanine-N7-)-methyltransferase [Nematocida major]